MSLNSGENDDDDDSICDAKQIEEDQIKVANNEVVQFAHKVIIGNFSDYIVDDFWKDVLFVTTNFITNKFTSYLKLRSNKIVQIHDKKLSVFVCFKLDEMAKTEVKYKLSIIDCDGKCCFEKAECNMVEKTNKNIWQIDVDEDKAEEIIKLDQVTILCEMIIVPKDCIYSSKLINLDAIRLIETTFNGKSRIIDSLVHNWKIENFGYFKSDEWEYVSIQSSKFFSQYHVLSNFFLALIQNEDEDECTNNLSLALYHNSSEKEEINAQIKISILDENGQKFNTRGTIGILDKNIDCFAFDEYISVAELHEHPNGLLLDDKLKLSCEIQILESEKMKLKNEETGTQKELETETSESYFNANPRIIDSLSLKWTIDNFECFYQEEWKIDKIISTLNSKKFKNLNNSHQFYLRLNPDGENDKCNGYVSLYLKYCSDNVDVNARWKISIIDDIGEELHSQGGQGIFKERHYELGFKRYIRVSSLLNPSNEFLQDNKLILYCEIQILGNEDQHSIEEFNFMDFFEYFIRDVARSKHDSIQYSKCAHKWTIRNFSCALEKNSDEESQLISRKFASDSKNFLFCLKLFPSGFDDDSRNYVSILLDVALLKKMEIIFQYKIAIIDSNGNKLISADGESSFDRNGCVRYEKFISHNDLGEQGLRLLNDDTLSLYCEILAIENLGEISLNETLKYLYFKELSELKLNDNDVDQTITNAKEKTYQTVEYTWEIKNFDTTDKNVKSILTYVPIGHAVISPIFPLLANQNNFFLRMFPNGINEDKKEHISIYFGVVSFEKRQVTCIYKISLLDCTGNKFNSQKLTYRFKHNETFGFNKFISHEELLNPANGLITNNKLTIHCEVKFLEKEKIVEKQNKTIIDPEKSSITNYKLKQNLLAETCSFTQPTLLTHLWIIDNFGLYFQSIQDPWNQYIEATKISHACNDQLNFVVRLYPKRVVDEVTIYYDLVPNHNQDLSTIVTTSVLDENNKKLFSATHLFDQCNWANGIHYNWTKIQLEPNSIHQLKLLFEYRQYNHYSSIAEMNQLDIKFAIDDLSNSWKVRRLIDIQSQSQSHTCIDIKSFHYEWRVSGLQSPDGCKSSIFCPPENDQIQLFLRMNSQSQDKMSICLCLVSSFEEKAKICVQISILDKNGNKLETKNGFAQLFEGESEYDCLEPFDKNYFSQLSIDEHLIIYCELNFVGEQTCTPVNVPTKAILPELNPLLSNCQKSDILLNFVGGKQLHAHRAILSARSNVFEAMFRHDSIEAQQNKVEIVDNDIGIFKQMLLFMYTGEVELTSLCALELMIIADKYGVTELKEKCQEWLCENISPESVVDCLVWSDQLEATKLKTISTKYFHKHAKDLLKTNVLKDFFKSKPDLFIELYLNLIDQNLQLSKPSDNLDNEYDVR